MFTTDSRTERFLDSVGAKWTYVNDVPMASLSPEWESINLGRSEVVVAGAVMEYGALMEKGSVAPAPLLWSHDGKYHVLDGTQRLLAAKARGTTLFSAYLIGTDSPSFVKKIRLVANYRLQGGYQESSEWTLTKAVSVLVCDDGLTVEEVAELGGWPPCVVRDKREVIDCRNRIKAAGGPDTLPDNMVRMIAAKSECVDFSRAGDVLCVFFETIKRARFSADEAQPFIDAFFAVLRTKKDLRDQFCGKLREFLDDDEVATRLADPSRRRYQPMTGEGRLIKSLRAALTTAEKVREAGDRIPYMEEYYQVLAMIRKTLQQIEASKRKKGGQ